MATYVVRVARQATVFLLFLLTVVLGAVSGVLFAFAGDLPQISALDDYAPSTITRIHASSGEVVGEFATQRRTVVTYDEISPLLRNAIIAAEDKDFDKHVGLSVPRILATLVKDIIERRKAGGASTITQQLARNLFLTFEKTWERKIKEVILAIQIEKRYTKREILTMYCNTIYFGHGAYGVEAASRLYFGKTAKALALEEAALIAGIIQGNVRQSPYINPEAAMRRRNYALQRMADEGFITRTEADAARARPVKTFGLPTQPYSPAPYFVEEVRQQLEARFGAKQLYENGLSVQTSARPAAAAGGDAGAAGRAATAGPAPRVPQADQPAGGGGRPRRLSPSPVAGTDGRRRRRAGGGHGHDDDRDPGTGRAARCADPQGRLRLDRQEHGGSAGRARRPRAGADRTARGSRTHGRRASRPGAGTAGRGGRARQPHRPHPLDGRRLRFRSQQVQPGHPGVAAAGLDVQARGVHGGDRSWLHAGQHAARCPGVVPGRRGLTRLRAAELRPAIPGTHLAAPIARTVAQRADRAADECARSEAGDPVRAETRHHVDHPALPVECPRRRRGDADGDHERLLAVSEPGRADDAVPDHPRHRPRGQRARRESAGAAPRPFAPTRPT